MTELIGPGADAFQTPMATRDYWPETNGELCLADKRGRELFIRIADRDDLPREVLSEVMGGIAEAVNAYYGGKHPFDAWREQVEGLEETYEREVYNLYEEIHRQANTIEEKNARIEELEGMLSRSSKYAASKALEAAELEERLERAQRDYEIAGDPFAVRFDDSQGAQPTFFTAMDGRVFAVGQRVQGIHSKQFATIVGFAVNGDLRIIYDGRTFDEPGRPDQLRRVFDVEQESDLPEDVKKYRTAYGYVFKILPGDAYIPPYERPLTEVLPGDE